MQTAVARLREILTQHVAQMSAFEFPLRVYWEDTDAGGVVFYANYLKFFERARTEWLRALGFSQHQMREQDGGMFVVAEVQLQYHRPARLDDELIVTVKLHRGGRSALVLAQQVWLEGPEARDLLCKGTVRLGWVDAQTLKPSRIPHAVLEKLNS